MSLSSPTTDCLSHAGDAAAQGGVPGAGAKSEIASKWKGDFAGPRVEEMVGHRVGEAIVADSTADGREAHSDGLPAALISMIVHTILIIALVLIQLQPKSQTGTRLLASSSESSAEVFEMESVEQDLSIPWVVSATAAADLPVTLTTAAAHADSSRFSPLMGSTSTAQDGLIDLSQAFDRHPAPGSGESTSTRLPGSGIYQRDSKSRAELGARYGATAESEDAVEAALKWLAAHQQRDGGWSFDLSQSPCDGRCSHSVNSESFPRPRTAATGLALLAFLGAGYSHHDGTYSEEVKRGLYFLREEARETNFGLDLQSGSMYGHGIAMMAISEAMAMTRYQGRTDEDLFRLVEGGVNFTCTAQHTKGGWRYVPGSPGDMTVSTWQVLSLISAQHGGVALRTNTLPRAERFVRSLTQGQSFDFGYVSTDPEPATTAMGLCLLMYLGQSPEQTSFGNALDRIVQRGPKKNDVYHDYYATLALHHARHREWDRWHVPVRDHLVKTQATEGHEAGSWHFPNKHGDVGGRLYTTAMSAMILEVYYRYLPLYKSRDEFRLD